MVNCYHLRPKPTLPLSGCTDEMDLSPTGLLPNATSRTILSEGGINKHGSSSVPANPSPLRPSAVVAISPLVVMLVVVLAPFICWCGFQCQKENKCCRNPAGFDEWTATQRRHGRRGLRSSSCRSQVRTTPHRERTGENSFPVDVPFHPNVQLAQTNAAMVGHAHYQLNGGTSNGLITQDANRMFDEFCLCDKPPTYEEALNVPDTMGPPPSYEEAQRAEASLNEVQLKTITIQGESTV